MKLRKNPTGHLPQVSDSAYIDETAVLCGHVIIKERVFVGPYAVIRADEIDASGSLEPIVIGDDCNVQDGVIIHCKGGAGVIIGARSSIAHRAIVHGPCVIGDDVFVGFNSVVFNAQIGNGCFIYHNAVIDGCDVPERRLVPSTAHLGPHTDPSSIVKLTEKQQSFSKSVVQANARLLQGYKAIAD